MRFNVPYVVVNRALEPSEGACSDMNSQKEKMGLDEEVSTFPKWPVESGPMWYAHNILAITFRLF